MKAVLYRDYGGSDVLHYEDIERPVPGPGHVLGKVAATSFNPVDAGIRGGYLSDVFAITFPHVPGIDVAGTITEVGDDVTAWTVGDTVIGLLPMESDGAAAEFVLAPADVLAPAPRSVALADSGARRSGRRRWPPCGHHGVGAGGPRAACAHAAGVRPQRRRAAD